MQANSRPVYTTTSQIAEEIRNAISALRRVALRNTIQYPPKERKSRIAEIQLARLLVTLDTLIVVLEG